MATMLEANTRNNEVYKEKCQTLNFNLFITKTHNSRYDTTSINFSTPIKNSFILYSRNNFFTKKRFANNPK